MQRPRMLAPVSLRQIRVRRRAVAQQARILIAARSFSFLGSFIAAPDGKFAFQAVQGAPSEVHRFLQFQELLQLRQAPGLQRIQAALRKRIMKRMTLWTMGRKRLCHLQLQTIQHQCLTLSSCQHLQHGMCPRTKSAHHQACRHHRGQCFDLHQDCLRHQVCSWNSCSVHGPVPLQCCRVIQEALYHSMLMLTVHLQGVLRPSLLLRHTMLPPCFQLTTQQSQKSRHVI